MKITQAEAAKPHVNLCLSPEEATQLREFCAALSADDVARALNSKVSDPHTNAIYELTYKIYDQLDDLNY